MKVEDIEETVRLKQSTGYRGKVFAKPMLHDFAGIR